MFKNATVIYRAATWCSDCATHSDSLAVILLRKRVEPELNLGQDLAFFSPISFLQFLRGYLCTNSWVVSVGTDATRRGLFLAKVEL